MNIMEKDAKERFERRNQNYKIADYLKEKGNLEFKNGNNEKAIEFYTQVSYQEILLDLYYLFNKWWF